ncbi:MAG: AAA family ATPase, partial [Candidatus Diapherotrites archaeon]|nr:AAA family ATPase [Candidatus Diapherotrites archaeon]
MSDIISADSVKKPFNIYDYIFTLEEQIRNLQREKQIFSVRTSQVEGEVKKLQDELKELREPPHVVGTVIEVLENNERAIVKNSNGIEFLLKVPVPLAESVKLGNRVALSQRNLTIQEVLSVKKDRRAQAMQIIEKPEVSFAQVGGLKSVIQELDESVILPFKFPERFEKLGIEAPSGVLLHGLPGTGKTLLAKAVANATDSTFISITGSELVKKYIGEGSRLIRDVFKIAREKKHSIIFIDEIDSIAAYRTDGNSGGDREVQRTLMQLLSEIDGFKELKNVKLIGATNRLDIVDPALLRPGRFDRIIEVPLPDKEAREQIFRIHSSKMKLGKGIDYDKLAELTVGANGAD